MAAKPVSPIRPDPPKQLFFAREFEFTAALPRQECAARLQAADQMPTGCFNPPIFVTVKPETEGTTQFYMYVETRVGKSWVLGTLRSIDPVNTQLSGKYGAGIEMLIFLVLMIILTPVIFYAKLSKSGPDTIILLSIIFIALFIAVFWYNLYWGRSKLFKILEQIVKSDDSSRPI